MGRLHVDIIQETSGVSKKSAGGQHANRNANEWDARLCGTLSHLAPPQTESPYIVLAPFSSKQGPVMCDVRHPSSELTDMLRKCTDGR